MLLLSWVNLNLAAKSENVISLCNAKTDGFVESLHTCVLLKDVLLHSSAGSYGMGKWKQDISVFNLHVFISFLPI